MLVDPTTPTGPAMDADRRSIAAEMCRRAAALVPALAERSARAEDERRISAETVADVRDGGFLRIATPARFGGNGCEYSTALDVAMEFARGCGSSAWCFSVWASHNWMVGLWPLEAQEEYFASGPDTISSSSFAPTGRLEPVDGGFRLSGRWGFSSGSAAGTWAVLGALSPTGPAMTLVPRSDYEILDTWFVSGLKATGSNDIVVDDVFVPAHRVGPFWSDTPGIGWEVHRRASYRVPTLTVLPWTLSAPLVGMAQGALDRFVERAKDGTGPARRVDSVGMQLRAAESAAEVDAARLVLRHHLGDLIARGSSGELVTPADAATVRRDQSFVARLSARAIDRLFEASGGHSLYLDEPMQRFHRDAHAGSHQVALFWDSRAEAYGRELFGLPPLPGMF